MKILLQLLLTFFFVSQRATCQTIGDAFVNPPVEAKPIMIWQWMDGMITKEGITADLEAYRKAGIGGVPVGRRFFTEIRDMDPYKAVEAYRRPVLIIHGDADAIVPIEYSRRAVKLYENARLVEIPHAGHGFAGKDFKWSLDETRQFLMGK